MPSKQNLYFIEHLADDIIGYDGGNRFAKISGLMIEPTEANAQQHEYSRNRGDWRDYLAPNAVVEINQDQFLKERERHGADQGGYMAFSIKTEREDRTRRHYFAVGDAAFAYMNDSVYSAERNSKYRPEWYLPMFYHNLYHFYRGSIPKHVYVMLGYPPYNASLKSAIIKMIEGKHKVEFLNDTIEFQISQAAAVEEITAAAWNVHASIIGAPKGHSLVRGQTTLCFDLGGGTLDITRLNGKGIIDTSFKPISINVGINTYIRDLKRLIDEDPDRSRHFGGSDGISMQSLHKILMHPQHAFVSGGVENGRIECADLFELAFSGGLNRLYGQVKDGLGDRIETQADQAMVFGGGGDLLFDEIGETLLLGYADNSKLMRGEEPGLMIFGASRGLVKYGQMFRRVSRKRKETA